MRLVILASPFTGKTEADVARNIIYARECMRDSLTRGEAPFASHLLYTQPGILMDSEPDERRLGQDAGLAWLPAAEALVVYTDNGISKGMQEEIIRAKELNLQVEMRKIFKGD
jgi:hypothetical protein